VFISPIRRGASIWDRNVVETLLDLNSINAEAFFLFKIQKQTPERTLVFTILMYEFTRKVYMEMRSWGLFCTLRDALFDTHRLTSAMQKRIENYQQPEGEEHEGSQLTQLMKQP
jgi:hypothetical protein